MRPTSRRTFLGQVGMLGTAVSPISTVFASGDYYRISTEETFGIPEIYAATASLIRSGARGEAGLGLPPIDSPLVGKLFDLGTERIAAMDAGRIDKQLLSLWSPGVQVFAADQATELAALANDRLSSAVRKYPERFAGLTTIAPQAPAAAALEIERGVSKLGLHGVLINSYTRGEFLDDRKFWPIFEAAQAHDAAIYIHPRKPSPDMYAPFSRYQMDGAMWGFHMESSTHAVRLLLSGVFDHFPRLKIVLGHMGEGLPFWLQRLDTIAARSQLETIQRAPSAYFLENFWITTSAMFWNPILELSLSVLGPDRVLFGVDYPFAPSKAGTDWLDAAPVSDAVRRKIYSENARHVFKLG